MKRIDAIKRGENKESSYITHHNRQSDSTFFESPWPNSIKTRHLRCTDGLATDKNNKIHGNYAGTEIA